jgi:hypothetical protein
MVQLNSYGGCNKWQFQPSGYFKLERSDDRWWLADP